METSESGPETTARLKKRIAALTGLNEADISYVLSGNGELEADAGSKKLPKPLRMGQSTAEFSPFPERIKRQAHARASWGIIDHA